MGKTKFVFLMVMLCLIFSMSAYATPIIPDEADWSVSVTTLIDRGSPDPTTSITNLTGEDGVLLEYSAATGGLYVGTSLRQYDYTTTAEAGGSLLLCVDVDIDAFTGWFQNEFELHVLQNGAEVQTLVPFTSAEPGVSYLFEDVLINLASGDTWGIRVEAGNYDAGSGVYGDITITSVPEPATMLLLGSGLIGLAGLGRKKLFNRG